MSPPEGIDVTRPNPARVVHALLGGKGAFAADRDLADALVRAYPGVRRAAAAHRDFVLRAARWLASRGIRQFIQASALIPLRPYLHEAAREADPSAAVAYVSADPVVVAHAAALESGPGLAAVSGDFRDPGAVLASPGLREVIDLDRPACVLLGGALAYLAAREAARVVSEFAGPLAPGSAVAVCTAHYRDPGTSARMAGEFSPCADWHDHGPEAVEGFLAGAGLAGADGGPVRAGDAERWPVLAPGDAKGLTVIAGIGFKPAG